MRGGAQHGAAAHREADRGGGKVRRARGEEIERAHDVVHLEVAERDALGRAVGLAEVAEIDHQHGVTVRDEVTHERESAAVR